MNALHLGLVSVVFLLALCGNVRGMCERGQLMCEDGQCIGSGLWCNDEEDCQDKSDEAYCSTGKWYNIDPNSCDDSPKIFKCKDKRCIPSHAKCNGHPDCKDGSDENYCDEHSNEDDNDSIPSPKLAVTQETTRKDEDEDEEEEYEYDDSTPSTYPEPTYSSVGVSEEDEEITYAPLIVTSAKTTETTTMTYYQKKEQAAQSTQKTYAPEPHHVDAHRYDTSTPESYATHTESDSRRAPAVPTQEAPNYYHQNTAEPTQRPPFPPTQSTPYPYRPPTQRPSHSYTQSAPYPHRPPTPRPPSSYPQSQYPHRQSPTYSQRPPNPYNQPSPYDHRRPSSYPQPSPYDHRQPSSYPQPTSYDHRQPSSYPQPTSYDHRQPSSYPQPTSYDHRGPSSYPQPTSYDHRQPSSYPHREPYAPHPYTNPSPHPSDPRRQEVRSRTYGVQPWSDTRLAPSVYTGRRKVPSSLHFAKNYTQIHERDNGHSVRRGKEWLIGLREPSGGWGANTSRALVALALVNNDFVEGSHENDLMKKYFKVHLGVKLLNPEKMGANQVAGYVNALLATCQDPRDFHGTNIVWLMKDKLQGARQADPFVLLSLCLADEDLSSHQVYSLRSTLGGHLPRNERGKDLLSLSISAFSCHLKRYVASNHTDSTYAQGLRSALRNGTFSLLELQLENGSFGSVYSTALAAQALMSVNDTLQWDPNPTFRFLREHQDRAGSFGDFLATYLTLPALSGRSLLHLTDIRCHAEPLAQELTPQEILKYRGPKQYIRYSLQFGSPLSNAYSVEVAVPHGINFFDVMRVADYQNKHFNFRYEEENSKIHVYSISDVPNDVERGLTWQLYVRRIPETGVPRRNEAYNGDIRELLATADQHYVFWYRPFNL